MKKYAWFLIFTAILLSFAAMPAMAGLADAGQTVTEGLAEFPTGAAKLLGGTVWLVGEIFVLPFTLIF